MVPDNASTLSRGVIITGIATTLAISPGIGYDPINLPKMLTLVTGAFFLSSLLIKDLRKFIKSNMVLTGLVALLFLLFTISIFANDRPWSQQLWGVWGRSTGFLTYIAFLMILLICVHLASISDFKFERRAFERLSYIISIYTLLQAADLDPINWSQKLMVATLGNINFMSSFLGLASISLFSRLVFEPLLVYSRLHYLIFLGINIFLIWTSESIQGIGVMLSGIVLLVAFQIRKRSGLGKSISWLVTTSIFGCILFLGTLGIGPFAILRQDTVIFRLDYWNAGLAMIRGNWLNGVGIDSYGDFYQEFRSLEAVTRTGPQRVANTAHNVFLDVASGSGVFTGLIFLVLFALAIYKIFQLIKYGTASNDFYVVASMFIGFVVFCLISINQIGVGIWGFIFMGFLIGASPRGHESNRAVKRDSKAKSELTLRAAKSPEHLLGRHRSEKVISVVLLVLGFLLTFTPNLIDARMLKAVQSQDISRIEAIARSDSSSVFHRNQFLTRAIDADEEVKALEFARNEIKRDARSELSLRVIAFSGLSHDIERREAIRLLLALDPKNPELRESISEWAQE